MKYYLPTLLLILFLCTCGRAQSNWQGLTINKNRNTVIATGGLNLRSEPGTGSKVIARLPFGTRVTILETKLYAPDEINRFKEYLQPNGWARVEAGQHTGYVFDAYLYYGMPNPRAATNDTLPKGMNTKYQLITNAGSADGRYDPFAYSWRGIYPRSTGITVNTVKPTFRYFPGEVEESLDMIADGEAQPYFFIGTQKPWPTTVRSGYLITNDNTSDDRALASAAACASFGITVAPGRPNSWASSVILTLEDGKQNQILNPGGRAGSALYLEAAGDFDGDGKTDFIISFNADGWDYTIIYTLFLSSEARPGELVRPVAMQYSYQGC